MNRPTKWHYHEEKLNHRGGRLQILMELGQQGWELCGMLDDQYGTAYFKRPDYRKPITMRPPIKKRKYKE